MISNSGVQKEMVNLLLVGKALSNVFDNDVHLGDARSSDSKLLKGIKGNSQMGYLSLFEHYGSIQVTPSVINM
jgi:hypothetical protein